MAGANEKTINEWLHRPQIREARFQAKQFAPYFAVLWYATDREPPPGLGKLVEELQGPPVGHIDVDGLTLLVPHPIDGKGLMALHASPFRANQVAKLPTGTAFKSDLEFFAEAYAALRAGNYAAAVSEFDAMAEHYPIEDHPLGYFAYAAAKTGDKDHLEKCLYSMPGYRNFDYWLAHAYFAGMRKESEAARDALQKAFKLRPSTDNRPILSEYQYAEAFEWLYHDTEDSRFRIDLLTWLKAVQVMQPTQAWAYAMEYSYAPTGPDKTRALAITRYLDPQSARIRGASNEELRTADAWFQANNPFRIPAPSSTPVRATRLEPEGHL